MHGARDSVNVNILKLGRELEVLYFELQPDLAVEVPFAGAHHDRRPALARIATRTHTVFAADRAE